MNPGVDLQKPKLELVAEILGGSKLPASFEVAVNEAVDSLQGTLCLRVSGRQDHPAEI